ncbi:1-phosphofructokinase family hexose kinase, partial [Schnuerera sp.]|uniref:1-phosphofructokinase family hexose kinase n=1 Tax=Schnuerera sp. TaxID=2794844 RepID=UPI002C2E84C1
MILTVTLNPSIDRRYNLKNFKKGKVYRATDVQYTAGGKGLNVTKVIKAFNEPVIATGFIGGRSGEYIVEQLNIMGVKHEFVFINGETRSCIAILSDDGSQTEILERGPSISANEVLEFYELYRELIRDVDIVCASGSIPYGLPEDIYNNLAIMAKESGKKFFLDTKGEALKLGIEAAPFLVKPN